MGIVLLTSIICTTIVYSAYNVELQVDGEAMLRVKSDIRIVNLKEIDNLNNVEEPSNSRYGKDTTSMYLNLPSNSYIVYEVEIQNKGTIDYVLERFDESKSNNNVVIEYSGITSEEIIGKNTKKIFTIKISNKTSSFQNASIVVSYIFEEYKTYALTYDLGGGTLSSANPATYTKYTNTFTLNNPTRSGYEFLGWIDGNNAVNKNLKIEKGSTGNKTFKASWKDITAPSLTLEKISNYSAPIDGKWSLTNATINDGVLSINNETFNAQSDFIKVNGEPFGFSLEAYSDVASVHHNPDAGVYILINYYDSNKNSITALNGATWNGFTYGFGVGKWTTVYRKTFGNNFYGPDVIYIKIRFKDSGNFASAPMKIRNLEIVGQVSTSYYLINVTSSDNEGVTVTKYAKGSQSKDYFKTGGTTVTNNQITVIENGVYTVYVSDKEGNATIQTIEITNIE